MKTQKILWGTTKKGEDIYRYRISNESGMSVELCNLGASILSIVVPDRDGHPVDVALGYDSLHNYETNADNFGCIVGRYGNRIAGGRFTFRGISYQLEQNERGNHLHGASDGYGHRIWECISEEENRITFRMESPDGDGGYPGDLTALVTYHLSDHNTLTISYHNTTETEAFCNLTNHTYFNLSGAGNGNVLDHTMRICADSITDVDEASIPTGAFLSVKGTAFDFNCPKTIGEDLTSDSRYLRWTSGYDHNYVLRENEPVSVSVSSPRTGIVMEISTNSPGMQFYAGNFLGGTPGKDGASYEKHGGFCLETQFFPDSVNHSNFPSCVLTKDAPQDFYTNYRFLVK